MFSRVRWASSNRASSDWWPPTSVSRRSTSERRVRERASSAPASAASTAVVSGSTPVGLGDPPAAWPALEVVELVAQRLVAAQLVEEGRAVAPDDGIEAVGRVGEGGLGLRVEFVEAAISSVADPRAVHVARV